jgi:hypothetical protein
MKEFVRFLPFRDGALGRYAPGMPQGENQIIGGRC